MQNVDKGMEVLTTYMYDQASYTVHSIVYRNEFHNDN